MHYSTMCQSSQKHGHIFNHSVPRHEHTETVSKVDVIIEDRQKRPKAPPLCLGLHSWPIVRQIMLCDWKKRQFKRSLVTSGSGSVVHLSLVSTTCQCQMAKGTRLTMYQRRCPAVLICHSTVLAALPERHHLLVYFCRRTRAWKV